NSSNPMFWPHTVLRAHLSTGEDFVVDFLAQKFGWKDHVTFLDEFSRCKVSSYNSAFGCEDVGVAPQYTPIGELGLKLARDDVMTRLVKGLNDYLKTASSKLDYISDLPRLTDVFWHKHVLGIGKAVDGALIKAVDAIRHAGKYRQYIAFDPN